MKKTGCAPCRRTVSAWRFAYSSKAPRNSGWTGHWLQSIMTATSNSRSGRLKVTTFWSSMV